MKLSNEEEFEILLPTLEDPVCVRAIDRLQALEREEAKFIRFMEQLGDDLDDWIPIKRCNEHLEEIWSKQSY